MPVFWLVPEIVSEFFFCGRRSTLRIVPVCTCDYDCKDYVNFEEDQFESDIEIDRVPLIIIDNDPNKIFKGKAAFDKVDEIKNSIAPPKKIKNSLGYGNKSVTFMPEDSSENKKKIDLDAKF